MILKIHALTVFELFSTQVGDRACKAPFCGAEQVPTILLLLVALLGGFPAIWLGVVLIQDYGPLSAAGDYQGKGKDMCLIIPLVIISAAYVAFLLYITNVFYLYTPVKQLAAKANVQITHAFKPSIRRLTARVFAHAY
jgi:hypothetical protein